MNIHSITNFRQLEIRTAEPSPSKVEIAIAKLKRYKLPGTDKILAELILAGGKTLSQIYSLINYTLNKEELRQQEKGSIVVQTYKSSKTDCGNY
jgi:hypothetical protein